MKGNKNFEHWLINVKGYSLKTVEVYSKYISVLLQNNSNYIKAMHQYSKVTNNTKRVVLSSFKKYYQFTNDDRQLQIVLPKKEKRVQDFVSYDDYSKIIEFLKNHKSNTLGLIMIRLLFETGIRSSELLNIKTTDVFNNRIRIYGKNRLERYVYVCESLKNQISQLKKLRIKKQQTYLFPIGYKALYKRVKNLSKRIDKNLTPHMFRRGFATYCILHNIGIFHVSLMMGHENINTTKSYIKCSYFEETMTQIFNKNGS